MNTITFIIGGCRSGKSRQALEVAETTAESGRLFIATCVPTDAEMEQRVGQHRRERGASWKTIEIPVNLAVAVARESTRANVILVDCLTLWTSNLLMTAADGGETIEHHTAALIDSLKKSGCPVILVSNETGTGIVPENALARKFRDMVGTVNQQVAAAADRVIWMVAGIPVEIKKGNRPDK